MAEIRTYYLEDLDENIVPHPWNVNNLKGIIIKESLFCHIFAYDIMHYISYHFFLSVKQNIGHVWLFGPRTLGKLILLTIGLNIKQNLSHPWLIGPHTSGKLIIFSICSKY